MSSYGEFAELYDELMNDFDYEIWANYIKMIFDRYDLSPKDVLEMACGTGNLTYYLAKDRYNVVGFDLSEDMLSQAYTKLRKFNNVKLLNMDMTGFSFKKKFDSIICVCDSINYIVDKDELLKCFKNVYNHLEDTGAFIFDINSYYKLRYIIGNNVFVEDREDVLYTWQNQFDTEDNVSSFYLTFFVENSEGLYERFDEEHRERAYQTEEILSLLKEAGFTKVDYFEGFSFDEVVEKTERINFIAFK